MAMEFFVDSLKPQGDERFVRLMRFLSEVLPLCTRIGIQLVLNGSLAVLLYSGDSTVVVNDIDLACHEQEFDRLGTALSNHGIACTLKEWHVLQARKDGLKIEFDSIEHWMQGLSGVCEQITIDKSKLSLVPLDDLKELYRRGLEAPEPAKRAGIAFKYGLLSRLR
jgi:hypothetical protein